MRLHAFLLPLALSQASLAASTLPSYDFASKPAIAPTPRIKPLKADKKPKPLNVQPRVSLGDLDSPLIEVRPPAFSGSRGNPMQLDSFSIGHTLNQTSPLHLQPQQGYQPSRGWQHGMPFTPGLTIDPQTGRKQAIPMHMLPALPPHQLR
ncbi:hypothetical protein K5M33_13110 [Chromobacterium vaccinii]|nr:hypothetical protein [Chromobacterium vaccinii]MBX9357666.1 hypothetical protein [Chromobacterium vaccinii]